jgi:hypothetical protein
MASATWLFRRVLAHSVSHHGRSLMASRRLQHRSHGRQWQYGNRPAVEHHRLNAIKARRGHDDAAIGADSLDPNQDLELNAFHHSKDSTRGTHVTTIPGCLVHHDGVLKPVNQLGDGYLIGEDIDISGVYWQPMQGERGAPAHGPLPVPDSGEPLKRPTPCRNWAIHAASIGSASCGADPRIPVPRRFAPTECRSRPVQNAHAETEGRQGSRSRTKENGGQRPWPLIMTWCPDKGAVSNSRRGGVRWPRRWRHCR